MCMRVWLYVCAGSLEIVHNFPYMYWELNLHFLLQEHSVFLASELMLQPKAWGFNAGWCLLQLQCDITCDCFCLLRLSVWSQCECCLYSKTKQLEFFKMLANLTGVVRCQ